RESPEDYRGGGGPCPHQNQSRLPEAGPGGLKPRRDRSEASRGDPGRSQRKGVYDRGERGDAVGERSGEGIGGSGICGEGEGRPGERRTASALRITGGFALWNPS